MAKVNATEFADKLIQRTRAAAPDYTRGVQRVTESPTALAAKQSGKWQTKVASSDAKTKFERNLGKVSLSDWQKAASEKGGPRLAQGVEQARSKIEAIAGPLLSHIDAGVGAIKNMPSTTLEDNIARSNAFIRHMSKFQR